MPIPVFAWSTAEMGKERAATLSPWRNITGFYWLSNGNLDKVAEAKAALDKLPEGRRVIFDWDEKGWQSFVSDPEVPPIMKEAGHKSRPQAATLAAKYDA